MYRLVAHAFIPNPDNLPFADHIDCNPLNNAANNLRWKTNRAMQNRKASKTTSKFVGVTLNFVRKRWMTTIYANNKSRYLGSFITEEEAALAYHGVLIGLGLEPVTLSA